MPTKSIPFPIPKKDINSGSYDYGILHYLKKPKLSTDESSSGVENASVKIQTAPEKPKESFSSCLKDVSYWLGVLHFALLQLRNNFYLTTVPENLMNYVNTNKSVCGNEGVTLDDIDFHMIVFGFSNFGAFFSAPLIGIILDKSTKYFRKHHEADRARNRALACANFATCSLGVLFSVSVAVPNVDAQYVSFVLQVVFRSFIYAGNSNFIAVSYPSEHFGTLFGISQCIASLFLLLLLPINSYVTYNLQNCFRQANILFVFVCFLTFVHPVYLFFKKK